MSWKDAPVVDAEPSWMAAPVVDTPSSPEPTPLPTGAAFVAGQTVKDIAGQVTDGTRRLAAHLYGGLAGGIESTPLVRPLADAIDFYAHKMGVSADKKNVLTYVLDGLKELKELTPDAVGPETKSARIVGAVAEGAGSLAPQIPFIGAAIKKLGPAALATYNALGAIPSGSFEEIGKSAIEGLALQGVLHVTSPLRAAVKVPINMGVFGNMSAAGGGSPEDIAAQAILGGVLAIGGRDIPGWAKANPDAAKALADKTNPSRKDFEKAGLPRMPAEERARVAEALRPLFESQNDLKPIDVEQGDITKQNVIEPPPAPAKEVKAGDTITLKDGTEIKVTEPPVQDVTPPAGPAEPVAEALPIKADVPAEGVVEPPVEAVKPVADMSREELVSELQAKGADPQILTRENKRLRAKVEELRKPVEAAPAAGPADAGSVLETAPGPSEPPPLKGIDSIKEIEETASRKAGFPVNAGRSIHVSFTANGKPYKKPRRGSIVRMIDESTALVEVSGQGIKKREPMPISRLSELPTSRAARERVKALSGLNKDQRKAANDAAKEFDEAVYKSPEFFDESMVNELEGQQNERSRSIAKGRMMKQARAEAAKALGVHEADMNNPVERAKLLPKLKEHLAGAENRAVDKEVIDRIKNAPEDPLDVQDMPDGSLAYKDGEWYQVSKEKGVTKLEDGTTINLKDFDTVDVAGVLAKGDDGYDAALNQYKKQIKAEKASSQLIPEKEMPFNLVGEKADDGAKIQAEKDAQAAREEANKKAQTDMFTKGANEPGKPPTVGVGGAAAGPNSNAKEFLGGTKIAHADIQEMRERRGRQQQAEHEVRADEQLDAEAQSKYDENPNVGRELIEAFKADPRKVPSDLDSVILERETVIAERVANDARSKDVELAKSGNAKAIAENAEKMEIAEKRIDEIYDVLDRAGTETGRALRARQFMMDSDFNIVRMEYKIKKAQDGKDLSPEQKADIAKIKADFDSTKAKLDAEIARLNEENASKDEAIATAKANAEFSNIVQDVFSTLNKKRSFSKRLIDLGQSRMDAAAARMKARAGRMSAGVDPTVIVDMADYGFGLVTKGIGEFGQWSAKMREAFKGLDIEKHLRETFEKNRREVLNEWSKDTAKEVLRKPSGDKNQKAPETQTTIKELFRAQVESGVKTLDEAVKKVHEIVKENNPDITPEEVRDTFSDYGKSRPMTKDETGKILADLRRQAQLTASIERVAKELAPLKTGAQRDKPSQRARELQKKLNAMMKEAGISTVDPETQLANSLNAIKSRLENQIADLDKAIKTHERMVTNKGTVPYDMEAKALQVKRDALRERYDAVFPAKPLTPEQQLNVAIRQAEQNVTQWNQRVKDAKSGKFGPTEKESKSLPLSDRLNDLNAQRDAAKAEVARLKELANPKRSPEQIAVDAKRKRLETSIKDMEERMASGDFSKKPHGIVDISGDPAALRAQAEHEAVKQRFAAQREAARWSTLDKWHKAWEYALDVYDMTRNMAYSADDSFVGRQGWFYAMSHPLEWLKVVPPSMKSLSREQSMKYGQEHLERENHKNGIDAAAKVEFNVPDKTGRYDNADDQFRLNLTRKIPGAGAVVDASNQSFATASNKIRGGFLDLLLSGTKTGREIMKNPKNLTDKQRQFLEDIGWGVNVLSGRGPMKHSEGASRVFGAPRFIKAAFDTMTGMPVWRPLVHGRTEAAGAFAKEYVRAVGTLSAIYIMADLFLSDKDKVDWDPRSSNFGAIKLWANHYLNPLAVIKPQLVYLSRMISGQKKVGDKVVNLRESNLPFATDEERANKVPYTDGAWSTTGRYIQGKLHPSLQAIGGGLSGRDYNNNPITPLRAWLNAFVPITPGQVVETYSTTDPVSATSISAANFFGAGVSPDYQDPAVMKYEAGSEEAYTKKVGSIILSGTAPKATEADKAAMRKALAGMKPDERRVILDAAVKAKDGNLKRRHKNGKLTSYGKRVSELHAIENK